MKVPQFISVMLHPIVIPTIGTLLYFTLIRNNFDRDQKHAVLALIFVATYLIPLFILILFKKLKWIKSFKTDSIKERKIPIFIMIILFYLLGNTLTHIQNLSDLGLLFYASTLGLSIVYFLFIFKLKTSIHTLSLGITTGFFFTISAIYNQNFIVVIIILMLLSGFLASSRLHLKAHTPTEVYLGFIIGFISPISMFYFL